jgi:hypothetical protein
MHAIALRSKVMISDLFPIHWHMFFHRHTDYVELVFTPPDVTQISRMSSSCHRRAHHTTPSLSVGVSATVPFSLRFRASMLKLSTSRSPLFRSFFHLVFILRSPLPICFSFTNYSPRIPPKHQPASASLHHISDLSHPFAIHSYPLSYRHVFIPLPFRLG